MLKRKFRLPRGIKFGGSKIIYTPFFIIKIKENGLILNRFSIVVSKKIDKRAVVRNRIKRIINSCIGELFGKLKQGHDMIIIVKKNNTGFGKKELCQEIANVLVRAGLIN